MTNLWMLDSVLGNPPQHSQFVEHWWLTFLNLFVKLFELDLSSSTAATASVLCHHVSTYFLRHLLLHDLGWKNTHPKLSTCSSVAKLCIYHSNTHTYTGENIRHFQMKDALDEKKRRQKRRRQKLPEQWTWILPGAGRTSSFTQHKAQGKKGFETSKELTTRARHKEIAYKEKIPEFSKQRLLITQGIKHICLSLPSENRPGDANP